MVRKFYELGGPIDEIFDNYSKRSGQINMAEDVEKVFMSDDFNIGILEGAVGVGKTLAYLTPAIINSDSTTIVATSSNTLLDQLVTKDLPLVSEMIDISYAGLKGINNYVCKRLYENEEVFDLNFKEDGTKGDEVDWEDWSQVTTTSQECLGSNCRFFEGCYYQRAKNRAKESDVLVINHHLLAAYVHVLDVADVSILPDFSELIIDEAHELESNVISFHSQILSEYVMNQIPAKFRKASNDIVDVSYKNVERIGKLSLEISNKLDQFEFDELISDLNDLIEKYEGQLIEDKLPFLSSYIDDLKELSREIDKMEFVEVESGTVTKPPTIKSFQNYFDGIIQRLEWLKDNPPKIAIWEENEKIKLTNIDASGFLEDLWSQNRNFILTSATIMVNGEANFIKDRLGIDKAFEGEYRSCFDYKEQGTLIIPERNNPKNDEFLDKVEQDVNKIVENGYDKTLVLFTSYRDMNELVPRFKVEHTNVLTQNKNLSKEFLLERFNDLDEAILIAQAASFGTGVDIKGDKNIILVKLNFDVPTDPLFVAQSNVIEEKGGNPFMDLSIPNVAIRTKQQIGRGIRSKEDKANIAILDGRSLSTYWGRKILNTLPSMTYYSKL